MTGFLFRPSSFRGADGLELYGCPEGRTHLLVPESSGEQPVTAVSRSAFSGRQEIESIVLPPSVRSVGDFAFYGCRNLRSLSFHDGLREVGDGALRGCSSLEELCLTLHGAEHPYTGLKSFLADTDSALYVRICYEESRPGSGEQPDGREQPGSCAYLYFPSYVNDFDEDTMARAIHPRIEGSGLSYREMVRRDEVNYRGYDALFARTSGDGPGAGLRVALGRLMYPCRLESAAEAVYRDYVEKEAAILVRELIRKDRRKELSFLLKERLVPRDVCRDAVEQASVQKKTGICGMLMEYYDAFGRTEEIPSGTGELFVL